MAYEQRPNSGSLFKNDRKKKETHPDYKGDAVINGRAVWISAWIKTGKKGKFMSLSFEEKEQQPAHHEPEQPRQDAAPADNQPEDNIPF